jgi:hypothetical protein
MEALFEQQAAERKFWQRDLQWLAQTAPDFDARLGGVQQMLMLPIPSCRDGAAN